MVLATYKEKFGIDRRKFNYSALIRSKQMTREQALDNLKKTSILSSPVKKVKKDYFTGSVKIKEISAITKPNEHDMYHVKFMKSSRTKLHYHTGAQLLIVTKGTGSLILYKNSLKSQKVS